jgi:hypothetical protein
MKVLSIQYLEPMKAHEGVPVETWNWSPAAQDAVRIYASGANPQSREATYAAEKDNRSDTYRPNEGMQIA